MEDIAFAMRVDTIQEYEVIDKLANGTTHIQLWERSAAFVGTPTDPTGELHRPAYQYLAKEFPKHTGVAMQEAPVFCSLERDHAMKTLHKGKPSCLLTLDVPDEEVLLQDYGFWPWVMLFNWCGEHHFACTDSACKEQSWVAGFQCPSDPLKTQAVLARVEPMWVVPVSTLPISTPRAMPLTGEEIA
jgi:hypothetical protein